MSKVKLLVAVKAPQNKKKSEAFNSLIDGMSKRDVVKKSETTAVLTALAFKRNQSKLTDLMSEMTLLISIDGAMKTAISGARPRTEEYDECLRALYFGQLPAEVKTALAELESHKKSG